MRCFQGVVFAALALLAGCANGRSLDFTHAGSVYVGHVVAVREVTGGALTTQITKILGQPDYVPLASGQEVIVRLEDGEIKTLVSPSGSSAVKLAPGDNVIIHTSPDLKISLR